MLRSLIVISIVIVVCIIVVLAGMKAMNRQLGLDDNESQEGAEAAESFPAESLWVPDLTAIPEIEEQVVESPEASWPLTPCSLYVSSGSSAVFDSLPEAVTAWDIPYETLLLVKLWALESGMPEVDIDRIYVFNRLDSLYVDLPGALDLDGLRRTIEARFICYTRLFPLVGGNLVSSFEDGIYLAGVRGVFRTP
jgi:hypothetical protein